MTDVGAPGSRVLRPILIGVLIGLAARWGLGLDRAI